jgi:predicted ArsR family transcriptional regulator
MNERERNERGQYTETITPERVLSTLANAEAPFMATGDVADVLECSNEAARLKLNQLHEEEWVKRQNVRGAVVVWWLPEDAATRSYRSES